MHKKLQRIVGALVLVAQFFQVAAAAVLPVTATDNLRRASQTNQSMVPNKFGPSDYTNNKTLENLAFSSQQFGFSDPLSGGVNYSDLTGAFFSGQYLPKLADNWGLGFLGELGDKQYRINGTYGLILSPQALFKISAERLSQKLPFSFDTGNIEQRVGQNAIGARFEHYFNESLLNNLSLGVYAAKADSMHLDPIFFTSNGANCAGFGAGLQCMTERYIAGGSSSGADIGAGGYLSTLTYLEAKLYYDSLIYNTFLNYNSIYNTSGAGGGLFVQQLLAKNLKFSASAEVRKIYDSYNLGLAWKPQMSATTGSEVSFNAQHIKSHNGTPDNNLIGLQFTFFGDGNYREAIYRLNKSAAVNTIRNWIQEPAVKMKQVLAVAEQFTHLAYPSINSIHPKSGPIAGGNLVTINGSNFFPGITVLIGGQLASTTLISSNTLQVIVPAATPAVVAEINQTGQPVQVDVVTTNIDGSRTVLQNAYTYVGSTFPIVTSFSPTQGSTSGGTEVTIVGTNLDNALSVAFDGVNGTIISNTSTQIVVTSPPHTAGQVNLLITTTQGLFTPPTPFTYSAANPNLTGITPALGTVSGGTLVTITGTNLNGITSVSFGSALATDITILSNNTITAITPAYTGGPVLVNVVASNGSSNATLVNAYTYQFGTPTISSANPSTGPTSGGTIVTIVGTGFSPTSTVIIGTTPATTTTVISPTQLLVTIPPYTSGSLTQDITVDNGEGIAVLPGGFTYTESLPTLSGATPNVGSTLGGTTVTLTGSGFGSNMHVLFGGVLATNVKLINPNTITAVTPAHAVGSVDILVSNTAGSSAPLTNGFTYQSNSPNLNSISPTTGPVSGGTLITLSGTNLAAINSVTFGGQAASNVIVVNNDKVTAVVPAYISGPLAVDVTVSDGIQNATLTQAYTYQNIAPTISMIAPSSGSVDGGNTAQITGTGFVPNTFGKGFGINTTVMVGSVPATNVNVLNSTTMTIRVPAYQSGSLTKDVTVNNGVASAVLSQSYTYINNTPSLSGISPAQGSINGNTLVTLTGTGFTPGIAVTIGGVPATAVTVSSPTTLTALTPAYVSGPAVVDVEVSNGVSNANLPGGYTYLFGMPSLGSVSPSSGPANTTTDITLSGTGFSPSSTVTIGTIPATNVVVVSPTQITATVPAYVSGPLAKDVTVNNGEGSATLSPGFTYLQSAPNIATISPNSGSTAGGTLVTINGSGFNPNSTVTIGSVPATDVQLINANTLQAVTGSHAQGTVNVVVDNGSAGSTTLTNGFTYTSTAPQISGISPTSGSVAGNYILTINGSHLTGINAVTIGGVAATNVVVVNDSQVTALVPAYSSGPLVVDVTATNTQNGSNATLPQSFTYTGNPAPALSNLSPNHGPVLGGTSITITGSGFVPGTSVTIGGVAATNVVVINSTTLTATTPAYVSGSLVKNVTVNNGVATATLNNGFTYDPISPQLQSINPPQGPTVGNTLVTLVGTGFTPSTTVNIGGIAATNVTVINSTSLTAITPAYVSASLVKDVEVINEVSNSVLSNAYTYQADPPHITSINPNTGSINGGTQVTIIGAEFAPGTQVTIGNVAATSINVVDSQTITAIIPAYVSGNLVKDVTVDNGVNPPATLTNGFTYQTVAPTLNSITPNSDSVNGGSTVTLSGSGFVPGTTVSIGGVAATAINIINASTLTATVPAYVSGLLVKDVTVTNSAGSATLPSSFTYMAGVPTLTGINPNSGSIAGGTTVTLTGTGFTGQTTVTFDGAAVASINYINPTTISVVTAAHSPAAVDVKVDNGPGKSVTITQGFTYVLLAPTLNAINPNTGDTTGGTTITLTGTHLTGVNSVLIGDQSATNVVVVNDNTVTATPPPFVNGSLVKSVTVSNGAANSTLANSFTYTQSAAPTLSTISPNNGPAGGGNVVTITGSAFVPGMTVTIGGVSATNITFVDATTITVTIPPYSGGPLAEDVVVNNGVANATVSNGYTYNAAMPTLTNLNPSSGSSTGGTTITLTGTGFNATTTVTVGQLATTNVQFINTTTLTAVTAAHAPGVVDVTVSNGGQNATLIGSYTYMSNAPSISSINPTSGDVAGNYIITLSGNNLASINSVTIGGQAATNVTATSTSVTATVPPYFSGSLVSDVIASNGTQNAVSPQQFTYTESSAPSITLIDPNTGPTTGGNVIEIDGTGFVPGTTVSIGGINVTNITIINATTLIVTVPAYVSGSLIKNIIVNNGSGTYMLNGGYTYTAVAPTVSSINPTHGPQAGGTSVVITGTGFTQNTTVNIGGIAATGVVVTNSSSLTASTPAYVSGSLNKDVQVTNEAASDVLTGGFTYDTTAPLFTAISPNTGTTAGGTAVTLTGSGFVPGTTVSIGGNPATSVVVVNAQTITVLTPAYVNGPLAVNVVVDNGSGQATLTNGFTYQPTVPTITSINPATDTINGGTTVTVGGSGFVAGTTTLTIGNIAATNVSVSNANTLTATIPAYVSGLLVKDVTVSNGVSGSGVLSNGFTYTELVPTITNITPVSGSQAGGTTVTITGSGFTPDTIVTVGGNSATNIQIINATTLTAVTPSNPPGVVDVTVSNGAGSATLTNGYTYTAVSPIINSISPTNGSVAGNYPITITGSFLTGVDSVTIGGVAATNVVVVNDSQVTATAPAYVSGPLLVDVTANKSSTGENATLPQSFTYQQQSGPTITNINPNTGSVSGGYSIIISGTGFVPGTTVTIGTTPATNIIQVNSTTLNVTVPAYVSGSLIQNVSVNNGVATTTAPGAFTYVATAPTINGISPASGPITGGTPVTITGTGFTPSTTASIGGIAVTNLTINSTTSLSATVPAYVSGSLTKDVQVTNEASSAVLPSGYTYTVVAPQLTSINPNTGSIAGGTAVTLTGSGFVPGTTVSIGGVAASSVVVVNAQTITAITPAYVSGNLIKDVTVNNGVNPNAVLSNGFTHQAIVPTITSIMPNTDTVNGGQTVTISGSGFIPGTTVSIGGVAATGVTLINASALTAVVPAYVSGALVKDVTVSTSGGSATLLASFTYTPVAPTLTQVSPPSGSTLGGTTVTLTGTGFTPNTTVTIGGNAATNIQMLSTTSLIATTPAGTGLVDVNVANGALTATLHDSFTYVLNAPSIISVNPNSGPVAGGTQIFISGTFLTGVNSVTVGTQAATNVIVVNASTVTATVPPYVSGSLLTNVTVSTGSANATLNNAYTYTQSTAPTLNTITPNTGSVMGGTAVTISGSGYVPGTTVTIGGIAAINVIVVNTTTITASTPAYVSGPLGKDVTVNNGAGSATLSNGFTYTPIAPTLLTINPNTGPTTGGTIVTLTGTGFVPGMTVSIGAIPATSVTVNNATSITATTPAYVSGVLVKNVTVTNSAGSATLVGGYTYNFLPTVGTLSPNSINRLGANGVVLTGTNFVPGQTIVYFDGVGIIPTAVEPTSITFNAPPDLLTSLPYTATVVVGTPGGISNPVVGGFTYTNTPTVNTVSPNSGPMSGVNGVLLSGAGFTLDTVVIMNGDTTHPITPTSIGLLGTTLTFNVPSSSSSGTVSVQVSNSFGTSNAIMGGFTYLSAPTITTISPNSGNAGGTPNVVLTGTNFIPGASVVTIGGVTVTPTAITATSITFDAPLRVIVGSTPVNITVTTTGGTSNSVIFTYNTNPSAGVLTPSSGPTAGTNTVTLTGSGFLSGLLGTTQVNIGGVSVSATVITGNLLTFTAPAHALGNVNVSVSVTPTLGTKVTSPNVNGGYTYIAAPTISSLSPNSGNVSGAPGIVVTGTGFTPGNMVVNITNVGSGTTIATMVPYSVTTTSLTFDVPANNAGPVNISVTSLGGTSGKLTFTYGATPSVGFLIPNGAPTSGRVGVVINGTGFVTGSTTVNFNGTPITPYAVTANSAIFDAPPNAVGTVPVSVTTPFGTSGNVIGGFTYSVPPTATAINPSIVPLVGYSGVTITGTGFINGSTIVYVGGIPITPTSVTPTLITFNAPAYIVGPTFTEQVSVSTSAGDSPAIPGGLTYVFGLTKG